MYPYGVTPHFDGREEPKQLVLLSYFCNVPILNNGSTMAAIVFLTCYKNNIVVHLF